MKSKCRNIVVTIEVSPDSQWIRFLTDYKGGGVPFILAMVDVILFEWEKAMPAKGKQVEDQRRMCISVQANEVDDTKFVVRMSASQVASFRRYITARSVRYIRLNPERGTWEELTHETYEKETRRNRQEAIRLQEARHIQRHQEAYQRGNRP